MSGYDEIAEKLVVWTICDNDGFPAPLNNDGKRAQPFWSSKSRVERLLKAAPAYSGFQPHELSWQEFSEKWVPGLTRDEILVGFNWSGARATGYDIAPSEFEENVKFHIQKLDSKCDG